MTLAWAMGALASVVVAALLAAADGALLAAGNVTPRKIVTDPERAHRGLAFARLLAHLITGTGIALVVSTASNQTPRAIAAAVLLLLLNVMLVEGIARSMGVRRGLEMVDQLAVVVRFADFLLLPVTALSGAVERALTRALPPADESGLSREAGAEQFREVVAAEADVSAAEEELLHGIFSLGDTEVQEVMVPRVDVVGIERETPWSEMLDRVRSSEHARFPVFVDTLDNVIGILYAKDLLPTVVAGSDPPDDWTTQMRPAAFIPWTKTIDQQLRDFKAQRTHIAIVVDEYGGTAGLVTIEDILEVIVGDIRDEYDEEEPAIVQEDGERFWVSGGVTLGDLSELLSVELERDDLKTVGGLVYDAFGRVPRPGESRTIDGFKVVVERVRRRRIERVYFERLRAVKP
jgi:CBS domain containing-hemolysin-like protein